MASIRLPFDNSADNKVGSLSAKLKQARDDVKKLSNQMKEAVASGQKLTALQTQTFKQAQARVESLKQQSAAFKEQSKDYEDLSKNLRSTERAGNRLRRVFGDEMFRKLANGQTIEVKDVARTVIYSEKALLSVGKALGADKSILGSISKLHPFIFLAVESIIRLSEIPAEERARVSYAKILSEQIRSGQKSKEFEQIYNGEGYSGFMGKLRYAQDFASKFFGGDPAKARVEQAEQTAKAVAHLTGVEIDRAMLSAGYHGAHDKLGKEISGETIVKRIANKIALAEIARGSKLTPEMEESTSAAALKELTISDSDRVRLEQAQALKMERMKESPDPAIAYHKARQEKLYHFSAAIFEKRVPANPTE